MRKVLEPIQHHGEQAVTVMGRRLVPLLQLNEGSRRERRELGVVGCAPAGEQAEAIPRVREERLLREVEQDTVCLRPRRVQKG